MKGAASVKGGVNEQNAKNHKGTPCVFLALAKGLTNKKQAKGCSIANCPILKFHI